MVFKPDVISKGCFPLRAGVSETQALGCKHGLRFDFDQSRGAATPCPGHHAGQQEIDLDQEKPLRGSNKQPQCARA
jgi:hypothetical protein